jgi:hypothetical protein
MIGADAADPKSALIEFLQSLRSRTEEPRPETPGLRAV